jgi:hypothetical protein
MRSLSVLLATACFFASSMSAHAEDADCNVVKNTTAPVEVQYHWSSGSAKAGRMQVYRDKSGDYVRWTQSLDRIATTKTVFFGGVGSTIETLNSIAGVTDPMRHRTMSFNIEGLPRNFDRRSDLTYKTNFTITLADGSKRDNATTQKYKFLSEGKDTIGSCTLTVVRGEMEYVNDRAGKIAQVKTFYYPELMLQLANANAEPVVDAIRTTFDPIAFPSQ